ncbi:MAG TPA: RQC domain-containing protein, partial [Saprospiraceae bacterium]|nr:RQC domain-containing protein [Saprospiraceae bacterium]
YRDMFEQGEGSPEAKELKMKKLERMYQFAEAPVCRRRTVLAYFDENYDHDCGNCDVCLNPPRSFDGTVAAQKALSALIRVGEKVGMNLLIDVLRGSGRREIMEQGYHQIKTYGAGKEYSYDEWLFLISQMLHLGLIEIAYDERNVLRVTAAGRAVLFEGKKVSLALPQPKLSAEEKKAAAKEKLPPALRPKSQREVFREELFELLRQLRLRLARQYDVAPYQVFSDATLEQMAEKRPLTDFDLLQISGVGERKLQTYGEDFIAEIRRYVMEKSNAGLNVTGSSYLHTWELWQQGHSVQEIAESRAISTITVVSHLATMYERGEPLDISPWVSPDEVDIIQGALPLFAEPYQLKLLHEHFGGRFSYDAIRMAVADARRVNPAG